MLWEAISGFGRHQFLRNTAVFCYFCNFFTVHCLFLYPSRNWSWADWYRVTPWGPRVEHEVLCELPDPVLPCQCVLWGCIWIRKKPHLMGALGSCFQEAPVPENFNCCWFNHIVQCTFYMDLCLRDALHSVTKVVLLIPLLFPGAMSSKQYLQYWNCQILSFWVLSALSDGFGSSVCQSDLPSCLACLTRMFLLMVQALLLLQLPVSEALITFLMS